MSAIGNNPYSAINSAGGSSGANSDRMNDLTMTDFIKMMVAELENQDPMNPMSNADMLSQISQMRSITSSDKLSASIEAMSMAQSLATASGLIGKTIIGENTLGKEVTGKVDKVTIENGVAKLYVGNSIVEVGSVRAIAEDAKSVESGTSKDQESNVSDKNETDAE